MTDTPSSIPFNQTPSKNVAKQQTVIISKTSSPNNKLSIKRKHISWIEKELHSLEQFEISIDPRSYFEVIDTKKRYGKNLRLYYKAFQETLVQSPPPSAASAAAPQRSGGGGDTKGGGASGSDKKYGDFFAWLDNAEDLPEVRNEE
jgi:hypothetical protein